MPMSFLLSLMHTVGKLVLSLMLGLADKRTEELLMLFIPIPVAIGAWFIPDFLLRLPIMRQQK